MALNLVDKTALIDEKPVELPAKKFELLALLIENQGKTLKKEYLFGTVRGSDSNSELQTLHVHINRLRQVEQCSTGACKGQSCCSDTGRKKR